MTENKDLEAYRASISDSYNFIVAFLVTVPFPARNMCLSLLVTRIISLKMRLYAGASLSASSTSFLEMIKYCQHRVVLEET